MIIIKLVRHGESLANTGAADPQVCGDHRVDLSPLGREQARAAGRTLGLDFLTSALLYCSPYQRTRATLDGLLEGVGVTPASVSRYEDPRLREVEHGYADVDAQDDLRHTHGWFYYRFAGGESPADCVDRTSSFLEGMMRQVERKAARQVLVVTHGLTIRCFVMRFLHLSVEQLESLANPGNCAIVTIAHRHTLPDEPLFTSGRWGVWGLTLRS